MMKDKFIIKSLYDEDFVYDIYKNKTINFLQF